MSNVLRRSMLVGAATIVVSGAAMAADRGYLSLPTPPAPPPPSWTGFYLGATAGGGWSDGAIDDAVTTVFCNANLFGCPNFASAFAGAIPKHFNTNPTGFIGGVEIGSNWQTGHFVVGLEADFSGTSINGSNSQTSTVAVAGFPGSSVTVSGTATEKLDFLGTARARLGFTLGDPLLVYATGGLAYGQVTASTALTETVGGPCFCGPSPSVSSSQSSDLVGWTVGGGLEWMFAAHWTIKAEYLYYDLGTMSYGVPTLVQLNALSVPFFGGDVTSKAAARGSIVRAGLNFKL